MIKQSKIRRKTVDLQHAPARPSRIRRDPVRAAEAEHKTRWWQTREWEIRMSLAGIAFFAVAIVALVLDIGEALGQ